MAAARRIAADGFSFDHGVRLAAGDFDLAAGCGFGAAGRGFGAGGLGLAAVACGRLGHLRFAAARVVPGGPGLTSAGFGIAAAGLPFAAAGSGLLGAGFGVGAPLRAPALAMGGSPLRPRFAIS